MTSIRLSPLDTAPQQTQKDSRALRADTSYSVPGATGSTIDNDEVSNCDSNVRFILTVLSMFVSVSQLASVVHVAVKSICEGNGEVTSMLRHYPDGTLTRCSGHSSARWVGPALTLKASRDADCWFGAPLLGL
jgi:hypothetical protein